MIGKKNAALLVASEKGFSGIVETLLSHGADVNCKDKFGQTPLMIEAMKGHSEIANLLTYGYGR